MERLDTLNVQAVAPEIENRDASDPLEPRALNHVDRTKRVSAIETYF